MFIPVAAAIVVFIRALLLVIKFLVIPAMERGDPTAQTRAIATIGALQTQEAVTRSQQALTVQPTPQPASTPRPLPTYTASFTANRSSGSGCSKTSHRDYEHCGPYRC
jgi:hypothetical protein